MTEKTYKWPKTPGKLADYGYQLRQKRLALKKQVEALEKEENELKRHMVQLLGKSFAAGIKGAVGQFNAKPSTVYTLEDYEAVFKYASRTKNYYLLQKRLNQAMVKELLANGKEVPGVGSIEVMSGNFTKVGG